MANVIIGIHGLGNKPPFHVLRGWWQAALQEGMDTHENGQLLPKLFLVYWSHFLHPEPLNPNETHRKNPYFIEYPYIPSEGIQPKKSVTFRQHVLDALEKQMDKLFLNQDMSINYSTISDMILRTYFHDLEVYYDSVAHDENKIESYAPKLIRERLLSVLQKHHKDNILLIAHSMGSIIAYDVLNSAPEELKIDTFVTIGSPLGLPIVINKIISERKQQLVTDPVVRTPECITRAWHNLSDPQDKVCINYTLEDDYEANSRGVHVKDHVVHNDYSFHHKRNPHKAYGYLRTSDMANIVAEFLDTYQPWYHKLITELLGIWRKHEQR